MKLIFTALEKFEVDAWRNAMTGLGFVGFYHGSILDLTCDAVVSPGNSFGFMNGGLEAEYVNRFGQALQDRAQDDIKKYCDGELLVGQSRLLRVDDPKIRLVLLAPTMRVPMVLPIDSVNAYLAARAVLLQVQDMEARSDSSLSVAFPGLGTGVGRMPFPVCAKQVRRAIDDVIGRADFPDSWFDARARHESLYTDLVVTHGRI